MADGRQRAEWERAATAAAVVANRLLGVTGGEPLDPHQLMPPRYRPKPVEKTPERKKADTRAGLQLLGRFLGHRG
jgi:hypothetical protein